LIADHASLMSIDLTQNLPAVFGRYILLHRISRGGMGEIFLGKLGEIQGFEKPIVIKKILPNLAQDKDFLRRFIEEAQIAIKLSHGNIVPVYEVGMVNNEYFLALQYVEGRDLRSLINRAKERQVRLPPDLCLLIVREIANGLAYAHRKTDESGRRLDLVHCDISPPNILVSWEGEVKIIDFGIAKSAIQRAQADENIGFGKFGYMAPEQLLRGAVVDRRADIYSTGVLLYELITGERLFNFGPGVDYRRVAREVTAGKFVPPSERDLKLTDQFDGLVMRALRTEAGERYQSAEEFRDEVQQHLYSMNPTISTDALAGFIQDLFADEVAANRQMLRSLSQTDMAPFRSELNDASTHTVSYALAGMWSMHSGGGEVAAPLFPESGVAPGSGEVLAPLAVTPTGAVKQSQPPGTRRLSGAEQAVALAELERSGTVFTVMARQKRRTAVLLAGTLGVLVAVGVTLGLALREGPLEEGGGTGAAAVGDMQPQPSGPEKSAAVASRAGEADSAPPAPAAPDPDAGVHMTFAPVPITKSDTGAPAASGRDASVPAAGSKGSKASKKARKRSRRRGHRRRTKHQRRLAARKRPRSKPARPRSISTAMVQRKFRQVRREYLRFRGSYGHQLDNHWQKILFANTFSDENKYQRLNTLLDGLRAKMRRVRQGG
jgi:serine/threonine protein kinase